MSGVTSILIGSLTSFTSPTDRTIRLRGFFSGVDGIPIRLFMQAHVASNTEYGQVLWGVIVVVKVPVMDAKVHR